MKSQAISGLILILLFLFSTSISVGTAPLSGNTGSPATQATVDWWSMFRHDPAHSGYSTSTTPNTNQTHWIYPTGGVVESSPAVFGGMVFVGSNDGMVYALNASTGAKMWSYATGNHVTSSPAVAYNKVYVGGWNQRIYALNALTGSQIWNYSTGTFVFSSPTVANGRVYIGSLNWGVYALNASTGIKLWNYTTGGAVTSSPAVSGSLVFVGSDDNKTYALNALTGARVWSYQTGGYVESSPAVSGGLVFVGSYDGKVYALNVSTGAKVWTCATGGVVNSSPAVSGSLVFVGSYDGKIYALNAATGAKVWNYTTGNSITSSPAVSGGLVFIGSYDGKTYALNALTGARVWSYLTGGWVQSSPAVSGGMVFIGSRDNNVYAFGTPAFYGPYTVTIKARCITQSVDVNVQITMDGSPTGYTTPHVFTGLNGSHTFTVPNTDPSGHPFKQWDTGETTTTITVTSNGTNTAYYRALPSVDVNGTVGITGYKLVFKETMNNSLGSQKTVSYYWSFSADKWNGTSWVATSITGSSTPVTGYIMPAHTIRDLPYYVYILNSSLVGFGDWLKIRYTFNWNYDSTNYSIACVAKLHVHPGDIAGTTPVTLPYLGKDGVVNVKDVTPISLNWQKTVPAGTDPTSALARADINGDGVVNIKDVTVISQDWLKAWTDNPPP